MKVWIVFDHLTVWQQSNKSQLFFAFKINKYLETYVLLVTLFTQISFDFGIWSL